MQAMYSVVHGGVDRPLRAMSVEYLSSLPFDGTAIGGSLGRDRQEMAALLAFLMPLVPPHKPVHLLGIADPPSVEMGVPLGIDTFDSCFPSCGPARFDDTVARLAALCGARHRTVAHGAATFVLAASRHCSTPRLIAARLA